MEVIRFKDAVVTEWSGGETHEILIYPHGSDFKTGNYDLRISMATVKLESTVFTSLPGVNRTLTVLEGNLTLIHENQHEVHLKPYRQDSFQGDWNTRSKGKVKDFNTMWKKGDATVKHQSYGANSNVSIEVKSDLNLIFLAKGSFESDSQIIEANDSILYSKRLQLKTIDQCEIIQVSFNY